MEECSRARFDYLISTTRPFNYLQRELHYRRLGSAVMLWIHTRAKGVRGHAPPEKNNDKNGAICLFFSECSKVSYYQQ